jgi:hypothetical protein
MLGKRCSVAGMVTMIALLQAPFESPRITDMPGSIQQAVVAVNAGKQRELCVAVPDGRKRSSGTDTYHDYATRISVEVFAKNRTDSNWGKGCDATEDFMACSNVKGGFMQSTFDLEPLDGYSRRICWTFVNRGQQAVNAKLVAHYTLREVKNGFVLFQESRMTTRQLRRQFKRSAFAQPRRTESQPTSAENSNLAPFSLQEEVTLLKSSLRARDNNSVFQTGARTS